MKSLSVEDLIIETVGGPLEHLSGSQLLELIVKYKEGQNVDLLIKEFGLQVRSTMLVRELPLIKVDNCPNCPADIACSIANKSSKQFLNAHKQECWNCGHIPNNDYCRCETCLNYHNEQKKLIEAQKERAFLSKRKAIEIEYNSKNYEKVKESELDVKAKIFVSVILRCCLSEDGKYIKPIKDSLELLTPNSALTTQIIRYLSSENILIPSSESEIEAFVFDEENNPISYFTYEVRYLLNVEPEDKYSFLIERLMYPEIGNSEALLDIWNELALHECLGYLLFQMEEVGYNFSVGATTVTTIEKLLETFSVGQIFNIIFRAVANSTRAYQSGRYTKTHAMNIVVTSCRNQGERAIAEKWDLKPYNRIKQLPESELSRILFTTILKQPNQGFYLAPTVANLDFLISK